MTTTQHINPFTLRTLEQVIEAYNLQITMKHRYNWRRLYPNVGQLDGFPHFGSVFILATDGILAYYHIDESNNPFLGHLKAFNGPIAKEYVDEDDWDFVKRTHKVNVFKRADGSIVVIPKDSFWDSYWSKHQRLTQEQHSILTEVGHSIHGWQVDEEFAKLEAIATVRTKSKRQMLLDTI